MLKFHDLAERIQIEDFASYIQVKTKKEIKEEFGSLISDMYQYDQKTPFHCYDLLMHTAYVVTGIHSNDLSPDEYITLRIAGLLHDTGKLETAVWNEKKQRMQFIGHANVSEKRSRIYLEETGAESERIEQICFLILHHDFFMNYRLPDEMESNRNPYQIPINEHTIDQAVQTMSKKSHITIRKRDIEMLLKLVEADAKAQADTLVLDGIQQNNYRDYKLKRVEAIRQILRESTNDITDMHLETKIETDAINKLGGHEL